MPKTLISSDLYEYCLARGVREHPELLKLRQASQALKNKQMLISPDQGAFMFMLAKIINAKAYLEIGVFTGYSTLWVALALAADAKITALDISDEYRQLALNAWTQAGVAHQINYIIKPALESLNDLVLNQANYDLVFIDANKSQYIEYYELALQLVNSGGLILIDNVLMRGEVLDPAPTKKYITALKQLNDRLHTDPRVDMCMLAIGDGISLVRKK